MDTETITQKLARIFAEPLPDFYTRRIVFWHDEEREFADTVADFVPPAAKLLVLNGTNNFAAKRQLEHDDPNSNYLVYDPFPHDDLQDNWLLNIELYSREFRADLVSMWVDELQLPATQDMRSAVKGYRKFFAAQSRRAAFVRLNGGIVTKGQLHLTVMAAICGLKKTDPNAILRTVLGTPETMDKLTDYGADAAFWQWCRQFTGYDAAEPDVRELAYHILLTAASRTLATPHLHGLGQYISPAHQAYCYDFVSEWLHSEDKRTLYDLTREAEAALRLPQRFAQLPVDALLDTEVFPCVHEWLDLMLRSIGMEPDALTYREKWLLLTRMLPLVENNFNLCELGPRSTGKSHLYKEISPNSILVSGGQTTVANLFYNMGRKTVGLVGLWDCVAFDEVAGIRFKDKDGVQIMKDYMASGSFARGKEEKAASASMVFVGNINQSVDVLLKTSSLFDPFPPEMGTDTAFLDRIHCYLPGWEIPKFRPEHFTNSYGFISDYLAEFIRELRKVQYGDALDKYFKLGKNLNQRDTIAVRRMVDGYLKLMYPNGEFTKDELEEILRMALEMRRRVKEQLKKLGGMEFYDVNFSYIDNETFEEKYVCVPEQGGDTLIPEGMPAPGQVYTISRGKSGMIGAFRLESQMLPGNGKFDKTGLGTEREAKEATNTAFNFLKANAHRISGNISTTTKDYVVNYQDLQGIGMTDKLALPTVIALCSIALNRPTLSSLVVLGDISIGGTLIKVDELANTLQACADCGAKKVLLPAVSMMDFATVPADLMTAFQLIPYQNAEDAVFKALGVE